MTPPPGFQECSGPGRMFEQDVKEAVQLAREISSGKIPFEKYAGRLLHHDFPAEVVPSVPAAAATEMENR